MNRATIVSLLFFAPGVSAPAGCLQTAPPIHPTDSTPKAPQAAKAKPGPTKPSLVLGKLGMTLRATAIHIRPDPKSDVCFRPGSDVYLVFRPSKDPKWDKVLLQNGDYGYVLAASVAELPKEVVWKGEEEDGHIVFGPPHGGAARIALRLIGTRFRAQGEDPTRGFDSAGFVRYVWRSVGQKLPRSLAAQLEIGRPILRLEDLKPGDRLYFWSDRADAVDQAGIYAGRGYFVHCSRAKGVKTDYLSAKWRKILVAARR